MQISQFGAASQMGGVRLLVSASRSDSALDERWDSHTWPAAGTGGLAAWSHERGPRLRWPLAGDRSGAPSAVEVFVQTLGRHVTARRAVNCRDQTGFTGR